MELLFSSVSFGKHYNNVIYFTDRLLEAIIERHWLLKGGLKIVIQLKYRVEPLKYRVAPQ